MKAYIYELRNKENNMSYVGISTNNKREWTHFNHLKKGRHHSIKLQNGYDKYGRDSFEFNILEVLDDEDDFSKKEQFWIDKNNSISNGYNMHRGGTGIITKEARKNMSDSHKGQISSRRNLSDIEAMNIYSIFYFYGKCVRPFSKVSNISRSVLQSVLKDYENVRSLFYAFDDNTKYSIFKNSIHKYNFNVTDGDYLTDNLFYLINYYYHELNMSAIDISKIFNKKEVRSINRIVEGKVKPEIYDKYINGNIEDELLSVLYFLSKEFGNPVPSLERNFLEGATTNINDLN